LNGTEEARPEVVSSPLEIPGFIHAFKTPEKVSLHLAF
jgi:hypothetical protein